MMARGASHTNCNHNQISQNEMAYGTDEWLMPKLDTTFKNRLTDWYAGYKNRLNTARIRFGNIWLTTYEHFWLLFLVTFLVTLIMNTSDITCPNHCEKL